MIQPTSIARHLPDLLTIMIKIILSVFGFPYCPRGAAVVKKLSPWGFEIVRL